MPTTTPDIKVDAVRRLGGAVELVGESYQETQAYAQVVRDVCARAAPYATIRTVEVKFHNNPPGMLGV